MWLLIKLNATKTPKIKDAKNYEDWVQLIDFWKMCSDIKPEKQGPKLILCLEGESREAAMQLSKEEIQSENGVDNIIKKLNTLYKSNETLKKFNFITEFENKSDIQSTLKNLKITLILIKLQSGEFSNSSFLTESHF